MSLSPLLILHFVRSCFISLRFVSFFFLLYVVCVLFVSFLASLFAAIRRRVVALCPRFLFLLFFIRYCNRMNVYVRERTVLTMWQYANQIIFDVVYICLVFAFLVRSQRFDLVFKCVSSIRISLYSLVLCFCVVRSCCFVSLFICFSFWCLAVLLLFLNLALALALAFGLV